MCNQFSWASAVPQLTKAAQRLEVSDPNVVRVVYFIQRATVACNAALCIRD